MKKYRANFFDKNGDETRSLVVEVPDDADEDAIETAACDEADKRKWDNCFKFSDAELLRKTS